MESSRDPGSKLVASDHDDDYRMPDPILWGVAGEVDRYFDELERLCHNPGWGAWYRRTHPSTEPKREAAVNEPHAEDVANEFWGQLRHDHFQLLREAKE